MKKEKIRSCKDLLLLFLYAKGRTGQQCEPIVGKTRLVKMVFLFEKEILRKFNLDAQIDENAMPEFEGHNFGPFSAKIYEDLEFLVDMGMVDVAGSGEEELLEDEKQEYEYWQATAGGKERPFQEIFSLTDLGKEFVETRLITKLTKEHWKVLDEFKKRCTSAPLKALLKYVYTRYPEMTKKSSIRNEVLGR
jgi:uncharacterized protein YwgA